MMKKVLLLNLLSFAIISLFAQTQVGLTTYDLQTNNSNCRRVATNAIGEVVITYTRSYTYSEAATDRGTGYNYKNIAGIWSETGIPATATGQTFTRFDLSRTGWSNVGFLSNGNEIIVSHFADNAGTFGGIQVQQRTLGTGAWSTYQLNSSNGFTDDATWPRIAITGDSILIVSSTQIGTFVNNVDGGLYIHRSLDGGATWTESTIPFVDSSNFKQLGADVYSIDANSNGTVAMVVGRYNAFVLKSTDFGATWAAQDMVRTTDENGMPNPNNYSGESSESAERQIITDESYSIIVDDNDLAHVWAGKLDYQKSANQEGSVFPFTEGLLYWNENMSEPKTLHASRFTVEAGAGCNPLYTTQVLNDPDFTQFGLYSSSFVSQPSGSYNDNGDLVVAYTRFRTAIIDTNDNVTNATTDGYFYKDVYMLKSTDGGETWEGPFNVSDEENLECAYPGVPRKFYNNQVPVIWQQDVTPGNALQPPTGYTHAYTDNSIMYKEVALSSITTPADETCPTAALDQNAVQDTFLILSDCTQEIDFSPGLIFDDVPQGPDFSMAQFTSNFDLSINGVYQSDIYFVDAAGNSSDTVGNGGIYFEVVNLYDLIGPDTLQLLSGDTYTDPGINLADQALYGSNPCYPAGVVPVIDDQVNPNNTIPGLHTYTRTYTTNSGNTYTITRYVEIIATDITPPVITVFGGTDTVLVEQCSPYTDAGASAFDQVDYNNITFTSNTSNVDVNQIGTYSVIYTATDQSNNTKTVTRYVKVQDTTAPTIIVNDDTPTPGIESYTSNVKNYTYLNANFITPDIVTSDANCNNQPTSFIVDESNVNTAVSGQYNVIINAEDVNNNTSTLSFNAIVGKEPVSDFLTTSQSGVVISLSASSTETASYLNPVYSWDFGDGTPLGTTANIVHSFSQVGTYDICLTTTNTFNEAPFNKTPGTTCKTITITGIADRNELDASIQIFPNPTNGLITVEISETGATDLKVEVTNVLGAVIDSKKVPKVNSKETITFDLKDNSAGVYFINISSDDAYTSKRIIVK